MGGGACIYSNFLVTVLTEIGWPINTSWYCTASLLNDPL